MIVKVWETEPNRFGWISDLPKVVKSIWIDGNDLRYYRAEYDKAEKLWGIGAAHDINPEDVAFYRRRWMSAKEELSAKGGQECL